MSRADRLAFVCPRWLEGGSAGGAETLLRALAVHAAAAGREVEFLTTCATDHVSWRNARPPGAETRDGITVRFFPVNETRDEGRFLSIQDRFCRGGEVTPEEERQWLDHGVNSPDLAAHLREHIGRYDRVLAGPYLFALTHAALAVAPEKSWLVPCLHDEPFATLGVTRTLFGSVAGFLFNADPERALARRLYGELAPSEVVGLGLDPFEADPSAFAARHGLADPYLVYCGRREAGKGTPLLLDYFHAFRERMGRALRLVLTGSGPVDPPDGSAAQVLDLGFVSEAEKREAMAGALAFCHPSVNESLGIVLLEAWMARTPALVHAGGAVLPDQCRRSGGGLWFRDYAEFEEAVMLLLDRPDLRNALGAAGRRFVETEYAWDAVMARFFRALEGEA